MDTTRQAAIERCKQRVHLIFSDIDIQKALNTIKGMTGTEIIDDLIRSELRGRGGAGFPTGLKWASVANAASGSNKYVVCNADEGEPGTFKDREILQKQAGKVLIGMTACSLATGASHGFMYLRGEYNYLFPIIIPLLEQFNALLKQEGVDFFIELRSGSGAYVCGEETSLLESLEGKRGEARNKPPYPVTDGYKGCPTVVNNVETLVYAAHILIDGVEAFMKMGTESSRGAKVFCISGDTPVPGIYELELGMNVEEFVGLFGDGDTKAVQIGGSSGYCIPRRTFQETIIGFEGVPTGGSVILYNSSRSMYNVLHNYLEFFAEESCGQCTPCRVGCQQLLQGIESVKSGKQSAAYLRKLQELAKTMAIAAKCGLGQSVPNPFNSIVKSFREEIMY